MIWCSDIKIGSTSLPGGNLVDGLPPAWSDDSSKFESSFGEVEVFLLQSDHCGPHGIGGLSGYAFLRQKSMTVKFDEKSCFFCYFSGSVFYRFLKRICIDFGFMLEAFLESFFGAFPSSRKMLHTTKVM